MSEHTIEIIKDNIGWVSAGVSTKKDIIVKVDGVNIKIAVLFKRYWGANPPNRAKFTLRPEKQMTSHPDYRAIRRDILQQLERDSWDADAKLAAKR
jgi:hypothetical protein